MKKKYLIAVLLVIVCTLGVLFSGCTDTYGKNILKIGEEDTFEYENISAMQKDWTFTTDSDYTLSKVFSLSDYHLVVNTSSSGWAQIKQNVDLTDGAYYKVEYEYSATKDFAQFGTSGKAGEGLFVTFTQDKNFNTEEYHQYSVSTSKQKCVFYFKAKNAPNTTVTLNIGTEERPISIEALTVYSFKISKVKKAEVVNAGSTYLTYDSDIYGEASSKNLPYVIVGAIAVALLCYAAYVMFQRNMAKEMAELNRGKFVTALRDSKWLSYVLIIGITIFIRLIISVIITIVGGAKDTSMFGYSVDTQAAQGLFIAKYGPMYLYTSLEKFCANNNFLYAVPLNNSPLQLLFLGLAGLFGSISKNMDTSLLITGFFIKFIASLADVGTAILIYTLVKKRAGNVNATVMAVLYGLLPLTFAMSGVWGLSESVTTFLVVLAFYFVLKNKYYGVAATYLAAFLFSWTAIFLAPIIVCYAVQQFINRPSLRLGIIISILVGFGLFYAVNAPFDVLKIQAGKSMICVTNYWDALVKNVVYVNNAFSFQGMLINNGRTITTESIVVTVIFIAFVLLVVAIGYFKNKNRMDLLLLATVFIVMMYEFGNNMTPVSMFMALALMLIYAIANKEKRVYFVFAALATVMFVNLSVEQLLIPYGELITNKALMITFGIFNLLIVLYYLYVVYDIVASKKARRIQPMTLTYMGWWKNVGLKIKKGYYKLLIKFSKQQ